MNFKILLKLQVIFLLIISGCINDKRADFEHIINPVEKENVKFYSRDQPIFFSNDSCLVVRIDYFEPSSSNKPNTKTLCLDNNFNKLWVKVSDSNKKNPTIIPVEVDGDYLRTIVSSDNHKSIDTLIFDLKTGEISNLIKKNNTSYSLAFQKKFFERRKLNMNSNVVQMYSSNSAIIFERKKENHTVWNDSLKIENGYLYYKRSNYPYFFIANDTTIHTFNVEKGLIWMKNMERSYSETISLDIDKGILYLLHSKLRGFDLQTGEQIFASKDNFQSVGDQNVFLMEKKRIYKNYIFAIDWSKIVMYDKNTGVEVYRMLINDIQKEMTIVDATIFSNELIIVTENPISLMRIPINQFLK